MTTEVATTTRAGNGVTKAKTSIKAHLLGPQFKAEIEKSLPKHLKSDRFIRIACTALTRTPLLGDCDPASFFSALLTLSQYGIEPDGRRAHLIPFKNTKRDCYEVQLIIDFKGLAELIMRSGLVSYIHADVVCEHDRFEYDRGQIVEHKIDLRKDRGAVYAAYAICRFKDGTEKADVMTRAEIEAIRSRSRAATRGPWVTDWNEMAKKTVFRRLSKWLPLSSEIRDVAEVDDDQFEHESAKPVEATVIEGQTRSDQLASMMADAGEESQVPADEPAEATEPETPEPSDAFLMKSQDIDEARGDLQRLVDMKQEIMSRWSEGDERKALLSKLDLLIQEAKPKKR